MPTVSNFDFWKSSCSGRESDAEVHPAQLMRVWVRLPWCMAALLLLAASIRASAAASYDLVIRNGHVIDGTGSPWYGADIGVKNGRIAAVGRLRDEGATRSIDAHGRVVAPGFIDML